MSDSYIVGAGVGGGMVYLLTVIDPIARTFSPAQKIIFTCAAAIYGYGFNELYVKAEHEIGNFLERRRVYSQAIKEIKQTGEILPELKNQNAQLTREISDLNEANEQLQKTTNSVAKAVTDQIVQPIQEQTQIIDERTELIARSSQSIQESTQRIELACLKEVERLRHELSEKEKEITRLKKEKEAFLVELENSEDLFKKQIELLFFQKLAQRDERINQLEQEIAVLKSVNTHSK